MFSKFASLVGFSVFCVVGVSHAELVRFFDLNTPTLDTLTGAYRYSNVNGQNYDILFKDTGLFEVPLTHHDLTIQGNAGWPRNWANGHTDVSFLFVDSLGAALPVHGVKFTLEDVDAGEFFSNFGYYDALSVFHPIVSSQITGSALTLATAISGYTLAPGETATYYNESGRNGGFNINKTITVDFSDIGITGFSFQPWRDSESEAGSVVLRDLGNVAVPEAGPGLAIFALTVAGLFVAGRRRAAQPQV